MHEPANVRSATLQTRSSFANCVQGAELINITFLFAFACILISILCELAHTGNQKYTTRRRDDVKHQYLYTRMTVFQCFTRYDVDGDGVHCAVGLLVEAVRLAHHLALAFFQRQEIQRVKRPDVIGDGSEEKLVAPAQHRPQRQQRRFGDAELEIKSIVSG